MYFEVTTHDLKQLERQLLQFAHEAAPFATRETLNSGAFAGQKIARADVDRDLTLRNRFTQGSIRVDMARGNIIRRQQSTLGSVADYMEDVEFGEVKVKKGSKGIALATSYASGEGRNAQPRKKAPTRRNQLATIQLARAKINANTRKQRTVIAVNQAVNSGQREVFLDLGERQGIFRVVGGRKGIKRGWPKGARLEMLYDLSEDTVTVPPTPWLRPSFEEAVRMIPAFYADALRFQLRRRGLFQGR